MVYVNKPCNDQRRNPKPMLSYMIVAGMIQLKQSHNLATRGCLIETLSKISDVCGILPVGLEAEEIGP
jgi:hypothetical protein